MESARNFPDLLTASPEVTHTWSHGFKPGHIRSHKSGYGSFFPLSQQRIYLGEFIRQQPSLKWQATHTLESNVMSQSYSLLTLVMFLLFIKS